MTSLRQILAHNLKKKRRNCGFSQAKLAELLNVSTHHIATIETARNYPTLDLVERMAKALEIEIYELFINPLPSPNESDIHYQAEAKKIDKLISESIERLYPETAKNIEWIVRDAVEKALKDK